MGKMIPESEKARAQVFEQPGGWRKHGGVLNTIEA
jgi:hypothetical protein